MDDLIYLDNHATTRVDPRVVDAMLPWMTDHYANAGSVGNAMADAAREAVEASRAAIAAAIGAEAEEIIFTSGATESNNLAIRGVAERRRRRGDHLVSVETEHRAVLDPLHALARRGYEVDFLSVEQRGSERAGWLDPQRVADKLSNRTCLVSVMLANNEIGVIQPLASIAEAAHDADALVHTDATQAVGKIAVDVCELGVDLMSFSAHKLYGPKGIGALFVRRGMKLEPLVRGGGQERNLRSGTLNVPGIVGFAKAVELAVAETEAEARRQRALRNQLWSLLSESTSPVKLCGPDLSATDEAGQLLRLPHNLMVAWGDVDGEAILSRTPQVAASSGAACSSADPAPSHVLRALGYSEDEARSSLRFGLGRFTKDDDVPTAAARIAAAVADLRHM